MVPANNLSSKNDTQPDNEEAGGPLELAIIGDVSENESEIAGKLLEAPFGGECLIYFDSPGGSVYTAVSLMSMIVARGLFATGVVTGECSSAALWPLAACQRRVVTPYSVLLFHPTKLHSEENIGLPEAAEWARHFAQLETDMDELLADFLGASPSQLKSWIHPGRYVSGREFAEAGFAELVELRELGNILRKIHER